jgi:hypothetical protein
MRPRLLISLAAVALIGLLTVVVVAGSLQAPVPSSPVASSRPSPTAPTMQGPPSGTTYPDFVVDPTVLKAPTSSTAQSKLWFADGSWWGALFAPTTTRLHIFRLDPVTQVWADTGTLIDERMQARSDVLWDGTHLYVISGGSRPTASHAIRVRRFTYDTKGKIYVLDAGFPVTISPNGASPAVITKDSTDVVWATFTKDGRVWVSHTLEHDSLWSAPIGLSAAEAIVDSTDVAAILAFGPGKVGVVWTNQLRSTIHASIHQDGAAADAWSVPETVHAGTSVDNELSVAAYPLPDGTGTGIAATVSTLLDQGDAVRQRDPLTFLAVRDGSGSWTDNLVGLVRDHHARPVVFVDATARTLSVAATAPGNGGTVYYKRASIDRITFETGLGTPLLTSTTDLQIDGVTSMKAQMTAETGLVALGVDRPTGRYSHAVVDLGGGAPTADPADPKRPNLPTPPPGKTAVPLLRDDFEAFPIGRSNATGWYVRPEDPQGRLSIVDEGGGKHALRVPSAAAGVRACRDIPQLDRTRLSVDLRFRVSSIGASDAVIMSMRGSGGEAGSVRVTSRGVIAWYAGSAKVRSLVGIRARSWYRVIATFDQAKRTYGFRIWNAAGNPVAGRTGLRWRTRGVIAVDSVCLGTAGAKPAQVVDIGEVKVQVPAS